MIIIVIIFSPTNIQLTDFKGPTIFICYRRISVIDNIDKEKLFNGLKNGIRYRQISISGESVGAGFNCVFQTLSSRIVCTNIFELEITITVINCPFSFVVVVVVVVVVFISFPYLSR